VPLGFVASLFSCLLVPQAKFCCSCSFAHWYFFKFCCFYSFVHQCILTSIIFALLVVGASWFCYLFFFACRCFSWFLFFFKWSFYYFLMLYKYLLVDPWFSFSFIVLILLVLVPIKSHKINIKKTSCAPFDIHKSNIDIRKIQCKQTFFQALVITSRMMIVPR